MRKKFKNKLINGISLSPEEEFIVRHIRLIFSGNLDDEQIDNLGQHINTKTAFDISRAWGVTSLLFNSLKGRQSIRPTPDRLNTLLELTGNDYLRTSVINERNYEKLALVLDAFSTEGVKVILLKGMHLAKFVYMDIGLRPMADVDIMVKNDDISKAEGIMFDLGYKYSAARNSSRASANKNIETNVGDLPELYYELYKTKHHHLRHFTKPEGGIRILEIHRAIIEPNTPLSVNTDGLWERAEAVKIDDKEALVLSPEDLLIYLCLHISCSHHFKLFGLKPYCDIAITINHFSERLDWEVLKRRTREWAAERYLHLTLLLLKDILGVKIPENITLSLTYESLNNRIVQQAKERILLAEDRWTIPQIERLSPNESPVRQASYIINRLFKPSKKMLASTYSIPESSFRIYIYYFVRIISLLYRKTTLYAKLLLYLLSHKKSDFNKFNLDAWLTASGSDKQ